MDACFPLIDPSGSPIDIYYNRVEKLLVRAQAAQSANEDELIPLLFLRLISATESYSRDLLSRLPALCPFIWKHCSKEMVSLGAGFHYSRNIIPVATLEHVSFCTKGEIHKQTLKITNCHPVSDGSLRVAIENFELVSQLRHSIVHSYDELFYNNVKELGILDSAGSRFAVKISPIVFQNFVSICYSFVRAYNRFLLDSILQNWIDQNHLSFEWKNDKEKFSQLFDCFYSRKDSEGSLNAYRAFLKTRKKVLSAAV